MAGFDDKVLKRIRQALEQREDCVFSPWAAPSETGKRRRAERRLEQDYRQAFSLDVDRILHSRAYTRYIDKTQVFYLIRNDHITHRVLHVQLVSKIARTIGRFLRLNEDLIEAIALGHDIGHAPFGHDGERFLSVLCREHGIASFLHNIQSVQFLDRVERKGEGWNLCLQTLDGILCHDGEVHERVLSPKETKTFSDMDREMERKRNDPDSPLFPMTLEGCVVRMADTVSYIGRDIEDAIRLDLVKRSDLPRRSTEVLGETNGTIVYHLVTDMLQNSVDRPYVAFGEQVSEALGILKDFNVERIYLNPKVKRQTGRIETLFRILFERFLDDLEKDNRSSVIFSGFLEDKSPAYTHAHKKEEIVRDFIAGMTDRYFLRQCPEDLRPRAQ